MCISLSCSLGLRFGTDVLDPRCVAREGTLASKHLYSGSADLDTRGEPLLAISQVDQVEAQLLLSSLRDSHLKEGLEV